MGEAGTSHWQLRFLQLLWEQFSTVLKMLPKQGLGFNSVLFLDWTTVVHIFKRTLLVLLGTNPSQQLEQLQVLG